jgi:hypothetical protein
MGLLTVTLPKIFLTYPKKYLHFERIFGGNAGILKGFDDDFERGIDGEADNS